MLLGDQSQTSHRGLNLGEVCLAFAGKKETEDEIDNPQTGGDGGRTSGNVCAGRAVCG
jgi:hypothetical protein